MLERWYPWGWAPNVFAIDYAKLQALGYKGILFDITTRWSTTARMRPLRWKRCSGNWTPWE